MTFRADEARSLTILRDAMLRIAPQDEVVRFGAIPKLHLGSYNRAAARESAPKILK
jgi:hypothetical protein